MKKTLPVLVASVAGIVVVFDYFLKVPLVNKPAASLMSWNAIVAIFAECAGAINLLIIHSRRTASRNKTKLHAVESIVLMAALLLMTGFIVFAGATSPGASFMYNGIIVPVESAVFSMLALFIGSAAYRAFRFRNTEASILLVISVLVLLGQIPAGEALFPWLTKPSNWIMQVLNVAGQRGLIVSAGIAFIGLALRILLGIDRSYLGASSE